MTRPLRRDRGSALVIAVIMIVVLASMIAVLLAAPSNQLVQVAEATAKERSQLNADAGVRDAVAWLVANKTNRAAWLKPGVALYVSRAPWTTPAAAVPTGQAQVTGLTPDPTATDLIVVHDAAWLTANKGSPAFGDANFEPFGDARGAENNYAYAILDELNGYYRIICEGRATAAVTATSLGGATARTVSTIVEAYVQDPIRLLENPAAVTFLNRPGAPILNYNQDPDAAAGWTNPAPAVFIEPAANPPAVPMIYTSTKAGGADKIENTPAAFINGDDLATSNLDTNAVAIHAGGLHFDNSAGAAASGGGAAPVETAPGPDMIESVGSLVDVVASLPPGPGLDKYTYAGSPIMVGSVTPKITYVKIPDGAVVTSDVFRFDGNSQYTGILVVDVGTNVQFEFALGAVSLFAFNGNPNQALGAFIFNQRGPIKVPSTGVYLADSRGNATDKLRWDSYSYRIAVSNIDAPLRFASYRVVK